MIMRHSLFSVRAIRCGLLFAICLVLPSGLAASGNHGNKTNSSHKDGVPNEWIFRHTRSTDENQPLKSTDDVHTRIRKLLHEMQAQGADDHGDIHGDKGLEVGQNEQLGCGPGRNDLHGNGGKSDIVTSGKDEGKSPDTNGEKNERPCDGKANASLVPTGLAFGNLMVGTPGTPQTLTLTSTGTDALLLAQIVASAGFSQTNNCPVSLAAGTSCVITVSFAPTVIGSVSGLLSVTDNAPSYTQTATLVGAGVAGAPAAMLSPSGLTFGPQIGGSTSATQQLTLSSTGTAPLSITGFSVGAGFQQTNNCPASLGVGGSCIISVAFAPTVAGTATGILAVNDNASGGSQTASLLGSGVASVSGAKLTPSSLNFGGLVPNVTSASQVATLTNTGNVALNITGIATTANFAQTNACPAVLAPLASCQIAVTFTPSAGGNFSGTLSVSNSADALPLTSGLSGIGLAPDASLSPATLYFGSIVAGTISPPQMLTLQSSGTQALTISGFTVSPGYTETNNCPSSLAVGSTCTINVVFAPTVALVTSPSTPFNGTLTVTDNAPSVSQSAALSGTGVQPPPPPAPLPSPPPPLPPITLSGQEGTGKGVIPNNVFPVEFATYTINTLGVAVPNEDCTLDYVAYGLNITPSISSTAGQANIFAVNHLYTTTTLDPNALCGSSEKVDWAYAVGTGVVKTSLVTSLSGKKVLFVESVPASSTFPNGEAILHVLTPDLNTYNSSNVLTNGNNGIDASHPAVPGVGNLAVDSAITFSPNANDSYSSPFVDYSTDVAYVGADNGVLYKYGCVFGEDINGNPTGCGSPRLLWASTVSNGIPISSGVLDFNVNLLMVGDASGYLKTINPTTGAVINTLSVGSPLPGGGLLDGALIDETNNLTFVQTANDGVSGAVVVETNYALTVQAKVPVGLGSFGASATNAVNLHFGSFDNNYLSYGAVSASPNPGALWVCGTATNSTQPALYRIPFQGVTMYPSSVSAPLLIGTGTGEECSAITENYSLDPTTLVGTDALFLSVPKTCSSSITGGCLLDYNITSGMPTGPSNTLAEANGTSAIVVNGLLATATTPLIRVFFATGAPTAACGNQVCAETLIQP